MIKVRTAKSSCLDSFSSCKKAEDATIGLIHICGGGTTPAPITTVTSAATTAGATTAGATTAAGATTTAGVTTTTTAAPTTAGATTTAGITGLVCLFPGWWAANNSKEDF